MSEQMKPCPFCGGEAVAESYAIEAAVRCLSCRAKIVRPHGAHTDNGYPDAIAAWNRRAPIAEGMDRVPRWHMDTVQHQMVQHGYGEYVRWDDFRAMLAASTKEG